MGRKAILACAVTANLTTLRHHPELPATPADARAMLGLAQGRVQAA